MEIFFFGGATNQAGKAGGAQASHGGQPKAAARSEPSGTRRSAAPPGRRVRDRLSPARLPDRLTAVRSSPGPVPYFCLPGSGIGAAVTDRSSPHARTSLFPIGRILDPVAGVLDRIAGPFSGPVDVSSGPLGRTTLAAR